MTNPPGELISYISSGLAAGNTAEALRAELKTIGWADADIDAAFGLSSTPPEKPKLGPRIKWKLVIVIASVVVLVGAAGAAYLFIFKANRPAGTAANIVAGSAKAGHDDAAVNDSDLILPVINVAAEDNAYLDPAALKAVTEESSVNSKTNTVKQLSGDDAWDQAYINDIIEKNAQPIAAFAAAVTKPKFQIPAYSDPQSPELIVDPNDPSVSFSSLRSLIRILELDALGKAKSGVISEAQAEALAIAIYGQKMAMSQDGELGYAVGIGLKKTGLETFQKIMAMAPTEPDMATNADLTLASFGDTGPSLANAVKFHYLGFKSSIEYTLSHPGPDSSGKTGDTYLFEPNKTINLAADAFRKQIEQTKESCHEFTVPPAPQNSADETQSENALGRSLVESNIGETTFTALLNQRCADLALVAAVRAALAVGK